MLPSKMLLNNFGRRFWFFCILYAVAQQSRSSCTRYLPFLPQMATIAKQYKVSHIIGSSLRARKNMMDLQIFAVLSFGNAALLASVIIAVAYSTLFFSPVFSIVWITTATPIWMVFAALYITHVRIHAMIRTKEFFIILLKTGTCALKLLFTIFAHKSNQAFKSRVIFATIFFASPCPTAFHRAKKEIITLQFRCIETSKFSAYSACTLLRCALIRFPLVIALSCAKGLGVLLNLPQRLRSFLLAVKTKNSLFPIKRIFCSTLLRLPIEVTLFVAEIVRSSLCCTCLTINRCMTEITKYSNARVECIIAFLATKMVLRSLRSRGGFLNRFVADVAVNSNHPVCYLLNRIISQQGVISNGY